jgi:hypothetical protein
MKNTDNIMEKLAGFLGKPAASKNDTVNEVRQ